MKSTRVGTVNKDRITDVAAAAGQEYLERLVDFKETDGGGKLKVEIDFVLGVKGLLYLVDKGEASYTASVISPISEID